MSNATPHRRVLRLSSALIADCYPDMTDDGARLAVIPIAEFLRLTNWREQPEPFDSSRVSGWEDCPMLQVDPEERIVIAHEGKHRLSAAQAAGYTESEIMVELMPLRFILTADLDGYRDWEPPAILPPWSEFTPQSTGTPELPTGLRQLSQ